MLVLVLRLGQRWRDGPRGAISLDVPASRTGGKAVRDAAINQLRK